MATNNVMASFPKLSSTSEVIFDTRGQMSRWSNTEISPDGCAAIVVPSNEEDIVAIVDFAARNGLKVLPTAGKHGSFLPINEGSIYLDLKAFDDVELDEQLGCVKIGGGVIAGQLCGALAEKGCYSSKSKNHRLVSMWLTVLGYPNSNAVGMVGYVLGGGSSTLNGIHSLAIDNLLAVRIMTGSGVFLTLSPTSLGKEKELYNVICGAGFGFGIITSITLKAWRISDLGLDNDRVWTRRLIFPPTAIGTAADLFAMLSASPPEMATALLFVRAPPSAPRPGAPVLMLAITYLGPATSAEEACKATFDPEYLTEAITASTASVDIASLNTSTDILNRHGDFKSNYSTWAHTIDSKQIQSAFESWLQLGENVPDAKASSYFVISARNPACVLSHDHDGEKFFPRTIRERAIFIQAVPWWTDASSEGKSRGWARDMLSIMGEKKDGDERVNGFAANLNKDIDVTEVWPPAQLEEIRRMKGIWDSENVFWNPVVDGM